MRVRRKKTSKLKVLAITLMVLLGCLIAVMVGFRLAIRHYYSMLHIESREDHPVLKPEPEPWLKETLEALEPTKKDQEAQETSAGETETQGEAEEGNTVSPEQQTEESIVEEPQEEPQEEVPAPEEYVEPFVDVPEGNPHVFNILLIGLDARSEGEASRSDTMILASINRDTRKIILTSFMRDIYIAIPGYYSTRLNAAYQFGGPGLLIDTLQQNFGIPIDRYARVNFFSFIDVVNTMGGVDMYVSADEARVLNDYLKEINWLTGRPEGTDYLDASTDGYYHLDGQQALAYCRIRYVGNADFERTERQRRVLGKLIETARGMGFPGLLNLLESILPEVYTDLSEDDCTSLLWDAVNILSYDIVNVRVPQNGYFTGEIINGQEVLGIDLWGIRDLLWSEIYG